MFIMVRFYHLQRHHTLHVLGMECCSDTHFGALSSARRGVQLSVLLLRCACHNAAARHMWNVLLAQPGFMCAQGACQWLMQEAWAQGSPGSHAAIAGEMPKHVQGLIAADGGLEHPGPPGQQGPIGVPLQHNLNRHGSSSVMTSLADLPECGQAHPEGSVQRFLSFVSAPEHHLELAGLPCELLLHAASHQTAVCGF